MIKRHTNIEFIDFDRTVSGNEIWEIEGRRFYLEPLRDGRYEATEINPETGRTLGHTVIITGVMEEIKPGSDMWKIVAFDGRLPDAPEVPKVNRYEIRGCQFDACSQAGYEAICGCYTHCHESFTAANDKAAIELAEFWQSLDDDEARAVIDGMQARGEDVSQAEQAYDNAPNYVACLYNADTGEQVEV